jgi:SAM-dependent methyltransferase
VDIFREVARVLKPGGQHIVSFSNRMFPTKAVNVWRELPEQQRVELVKYYFEKAGGFETPEVFELIDTRHHSGTILAFLFNPQDPVYIVNARKNI